MDGTVCKLPSFFAVARSPMPSLPFPLHFFEFTLHLSLSEWNVLKYSKLALNSNH